MQTESIEFRVRGIICRSCVDEVEALLLHTRGVVHARVSYAKGAAQVEYDPAVTDLEAMRKNLMIGGYEVGARGRCGLLIDGLCLVLTVLLTFLLLGGRHAGPKLPGAASFGALFLAGLFASPHCLGMCGGILLGQGAVSVSPARASVFYNAGRVLSYTVLGAVFGALGTVIAYSMNVKSMVFTMVGLAVALIGLNLWGLLPGLRALLPEQGTLCRLPRSAQKRLAGRPLLIGLLTGLMPCGSLYAMWLYTVSTGSARGGAVSMLAFSLGTTPLMLLLGALGTMIPRKWNKYFVKASAVIVTALGLKMLVMGLRML